MKKTGFLALALLFLFHFSYANHITGGEMYYTLVDQSNGTFTYHVVLKLYRDCNAPPGSAPLDAAAPIAVFNNANNSMVWNSTITKTREDVLAIGSPSPCINNPPTVCYQVGYYEFNVTLPASTDGYTVAYQRCCRIAGINNLVGSNSVGATYTAQIPGTRQLAGAPANNSAHFIGADTVIICANNAFCYNFGANDADGDSLSYSFCNAYTGGGQATTPTGGPNTAAPNPPAAPSYFSVPYFTPDYDGSKPLGSAVNLDTKTGMLCGIAPSPGIYVVTVCVTEYRNKIAIAVQRKDLQIKVGDCNVVKATLPSSIPMCDDFTRTFSNLAPPNTLVQTYFWDFGDGTTATDATPTHTYADTGRYQIKLVVNKNGQCTDSAVSFANVYPGFFPGFNFSGICLNKPTSFFDTTRTVYGVVNSWSWDFGDASSTADSSHIKNPVYTYSQTGAKDVRLIVTSNKGCIDTVTNTVNIMDKPPLNVIPKDTLICNGDQIQLQALGNGIFSWTPATNINNANTATPTVNPVTTTKYIVELNDNGCINHDTVQVRVVDFVSLQARPDTVICAGDTLQLTAQTNGLHFTWTPAATLDNANKLDPIATPAGNTIYQITSSIGHCTANDQVSVTLVPYPIALAGPDTTVCFRTSANLHALIVGSSFNWTPSASLSDPNSLDPIASPITTTSYVLSVRDNIGCPKPKMDTVTVIVLPRVIARAVDDTAVVVGQPLQLNAEGGINYFWSPSTGLNRVDIANPVGNYDGSFDSIRYMVLVRNESGCSDSAFVVVHVFKTNPQIFVPTAFTPNGDGKNDVFSPIAVGISKLDYFRVYNRWGQLVFSTTINGQGWDGRIGGKEQATNTYVWVVRGTDFTGKVVFAKGTVTLIR